MLNFISTVIFTATIEHFAKLYKRFKSKRISGRSLKGLKRETDVGHFQARRQQQQRIYQIFPNTKISCG